MFFSFIFFLNLIFKKFYNYYIRFFFLFLIRRITNASVSMNWEYESWLFFYEDHYLVYEYMPIYIEFLL